MKQLSIRRYVGVLTLLPLLMMAIGLGAYFLSVRASDLDRDLMERGKLVARQLASSGEYGVFSNNQAFLYSLAQGVLQQPDIHGALILSDVSKSWIEAGEFSEGAEEAITGEKSASQSATSRQARIGKIKELVNLTHPLFSGRKSIWIYQPIIPTQVALDDIRGKPADQPIGAVIIEISKESTQQLKSQMQWVTVGVTVIFLMFSMALAYLVSRRITTPIRELSKVVQMIGRGHLEARVAVPAEVTELDILARGINDMTEQLEQECANLHYQVEEATRIAAIVFESHEGMMVTDSKGEILRVNSAFTKITGYSDKEAVGRTPRLLKSGRQHDDFYAEMWESIVRQGGWQGEIWNRHKDGDVYPAWVTITAVNNESGEIAYYVATYTDITLRKAIENEVKSLAYYDVLTKLPNRRTFTDRLSQAMAASKRSNRYGAVMFIDLDNFKPLNDQYGHAVGDLLLTEVARRLVSCVREEDTVARFGGDEFVVMLRELDASKSESIVQASAIAEKIRAILSEPYALSIRIKDLTEAHVSHQCSASIGIVLFVNHETSLEEILKCADMAMYKAKREGRNAIRFHSY
ncbi:MAG: diguanylate cyclase [Nitrosomonadales bacterium]|nr:diguanylate cyclase [Nitrosomonadales bacterium]